MNARAVDFVRNVLAALCAVLCLNVFGQTQDAERPLQIVVGFPPGQSTDIVARLIAEKLASAMRRSVIVVNRPGQAGSVALGAVAKMPPDGNTVTLSAVAALVMNPHLYKTISYNTLQDFEPITLVYDAPLLLVANTDLPVRSLADLLALAKRTPNSLSFSSSGNGTLTHLGMVDLMRRTGVQMQHIPYDGSAKAMTDLIGGRVQVGMDTGIVTIPHIKAGRLRALAATSLNRMAVLPDTPTIAEQGYPGFEAVPWIGMLAPVGTPKEIILRLNREITKIVASDEFRARLDVMGAQPRNSDPAQFADYLKAENSKWGTLVRASGATVD